jgi:hypothetical protein
MPRLTASSATWLPTNPVPPVMKTVILNGLFVQWLSDFSSNTEIEEISLNPRGLPIG